MIQHSNELEHLEIPQISERLHERLQAHKTRYNRLMEQHEMLVKEEKIRYIRDLFIMLAAFLAIVALIVRLTRNSK